MTIPKKLAPYIPLANMLAASFGNKCEVVIHDLSNPQNSVVYVANGFVTNRKIGQSFDRLVTDVLLSKSFRNDYHANYTFVTEDGKTIKSSTSLIRDEDETVIGAVCINIDINDFSKMNTFLTQFLNVIPETDQKNNSREIGDFENVIEIIDDLIDKAIENENVEKLKKKDNIRLITFLYDKGIFLTKGAVDKVAGKLNISPVTVYAYLDQIKKDRKSDR